MEKITKIQDVGNQIRRARKKPIIVNFSIVREKNYSPTGIFNEALKDLGFKENQEVKVRRIKMERKVERKVKIGLMLFLIGLFSIGLNNLRGDMLIMWLGFIPTMAGVYLFLTEEETE